MDINTGIAIAGLIINGLLAVNVLRVKNEVLGLKVWILENFERISP